MSEKLVEEMVLMLRWFYDAGQADERDYHKAGEFTKSLFRSNAIQAITNIAQAFVNGGLDQWLKEMGLVGRGIFSSELRGIVWLSGTRILEDRDIIIAFRQDSKERLPEEKDGLS